TGIGFTPEDDGLDVEGHHAAFVEPAADLGGGRIRPAVRVEPDFCAFEAGGRGDLDGLGRADVEHRPGGEREQALAHQGWVAVQALSQYGARRARLFTLPMAVRPTDSTISTWRGHL